MNEGLPHAANALTGHPLHDAKRALRTTMIAARDAIPAAEHLASSQRIAEVICTSPAFATARCVLLTLPHKSEWDMRGVFTAALAAGKRVALPRVNLGSRMLELHRVIDPEHEVGIGYRGIPEPLSTTPRIAAADIDWILVPGVAFDETGARLGYGGGFYDRLLAQMAPQIPRVAGAFDLQLVPRVPAAPHDLRVDRIVTEGRDLALTHRG